MSDKLVEGGQVVARLRWYECTDYAACAYVDAAGSWDGETGEPGDWHEIAHIFLKWDGCAHVGLRDPELDSEWVHVCGARNFAQTLRILAWAAAEAQKRIPNYQVETGDDYTAIRVEGGKP